MLWQRMGAALHVRITRDEGGQVLHLPRGVELPGTEASIRRDGARLVIEPIGVPLRARHPSNQALLDLLATLDPIDEEIGPIEDHPPEPVEL